MQQSPSVPGVYRSSLHSYMFPYVATYVVLVLVLLLVLVNIGRCSSKKPRLLLFKSDRAGTLVLQVNKHRLTKSYF